MNELELILLTGAGLLVCLWEMDFHLHAVADLITNRRTEAARGTNNPGNMQWQTKEAAKVKDKPE